MNHLWKKKICLWELEVKTPKWQDWRAWDKIKLTLNKLKIKLVTNSCSSSLLIADRKSTCKVAEQTKHDRIYVGRICLEEINKFELVHPMFIVVFALLLTYTNIFQGNQFSKTFQLHLYIQNERLQLFSSQNWSVQASLSMSIC